MKYRFWFFGLAFALVACGGNNSNLTNEEKQKIKQAKLDSITEVKFNEINRDDVDTYPIFKGICADTLSKEEQKKCFETSFVKLLHDKLQKEKLEVVAPIDDKILVDIRVSSSGEIVLVKVDASDRAFELLANANQTFEEILITHLSNISKENSIEPATKQGLEVSTQFTIPIVVNIK